MYLSDGAVGQSAVVREEEPQRVVLHEDCRVGGVLAETAWLCPQTADTAADRAIVNNVFLIRNILYKTNPSLT